MNALERLRSLDTTEADRRSRTMRADMARPAAQPAAQQEAPQAVGNIIGARTKNSAARYANRIAPESRFGWGSGRGGNVQAGNPSETGAFEDANDPSVTKLVGGAALKGLDQAMGSLTGAADLFVGRNITNLGKLLGQDWSGNPISALNERMNEAQETNRAYFQENVDRFGKIGQAVDKYGTMAAAAVPQALMAMATAGGSGAAEGLKTAANAAPGVLASIRTGTQAMLRDPQYWLSFFSTVNDSAEQARADGADDVHAALYAMTNSLFNAGVEVGGGIQTLPKELRAGKTAALEWVRSMVDEGKEEVVQGVLERGLQNLIYQKENPVFSATDPDAVFNPRTAAEEFTGGAVVGGLLGGGQVLAGRAMDAVAGRNLDVNAREAEAAPAERSGALDSVEGREKTAPKERTEGIGGIKQPYDPIMAGVIRREGKTFRNLVAGWDTSVSDFFNKWRNGRTDQNRDKLEKLYLGQMTDSVRQQVSDILGYAVDNRHIIITNDDIKHIFDHHGDASAEIQRGNLPLAQWAIDAIPEVVTNPDSITPGEIGRGKKDGGKQGVLFSKSFEDGHVVTIQFDNKGRGTMEIKTMYIKNKDTPSVLYESAAANSSALRPKRTEPVSLENSLLQSEENGNGKKRTFATDTENVNPRGDGLGAANAGFTTRGMEGAERRGKNNNGGYDVDVAQYMRDLYAANAAAQLAALEEVYQQNTAGLAKNARQPPRSDSAARNAGNENAPLQRSVDSGDMLIRQYAYDLATVMLAKGEMPDAATLSAAGISSADAMSMMIAALQKQKPAYRSGPSSPQAAAKPKDSGNVIVSDGQLSKYAQTVLSNLRDSAAKNHGLTSAQKYTYDRQVQDGMLSEEELEYILNRLGL